MTNMTVPDEPNKTTSNQDSDTTHGETIRTPENEPAIPSLETDSGAASNIKPYGSTVSEFETVLKNQPRICLTSSTSPRTSAQTASAETSRYNYILNNPPKVMLKCFVPTTPEKEKNKKSSARKT